MARYHPFIVDACIPEGFGKGKMQTVGIYPENVSKKQVEVSRKKNTRQATQ